MVVTELRLKITVFFTLSCNCLEWYLDIMNLSINHART